MRTKERKRERRERGERSLAGIRKGKEKRRTFVGGGSGKRERERERERGRSEVEVEWQRWWRRINSGGGGVCWQTITEGHL